MAIVAWKVALLAIIAVLNGCGGAALAITAFLTMFPVLMFTFDIDPISAIFVCFVVDVMNGLIIGFRYRKLLHHIGSWQRPVILVIECIIISVSCAATYGIEFLARSGPNIGVAASAAIIVLGLFFIIRGYRNRKNKTRDDEDSEEEQVVSASVVIGPGESRTSDISRDMTEAKTSSTKDLEVAQSEQSDTPKRSFCFKYGSYIFFALIGVGMGSVGFGGGNGMAVILFNTQQMNILSSTAVSGPMMSVSLLGVIALYIYRDVVVWDDIILPLEISLPCNFVAIIIASHFAYHFEEYKLNLLIGVIFFVIGVFVAVYRGLL